MLILKNRLSSTAYGSQSVRISVSGLLFLTLVSCSPNQKGFKDYITSKGEKPEEGQSYLNEDWKKFDIDESPRLDPSLSKDADGNPLELPKLLKNGESWLPRTLLVRDIKVSWSPDRLKVFVRGSAQWSNPSTKSSGDVQFALAGNWDNASGISDLVMINSEMDKLNGHIKKMNQYKDIQVRGRSYCIGISEIFECNNTINEIFVRVEGVIYSGQITNTISTLENSPSSHEEHEGHDDKEAGTHLDNSERNSVEEDEETIHDEVEQEELGYEIVDKTRASDVQSLFDSKNIDMPSDKVTIEPLLPLPVEPKGWEKHQLPKLKEDQELQEIIDSVNKNQPQQTNQTSSTINSPVEPTELMPKTQEQIPIPQVKPTRKVEGDSSYYQQGPIIPGQKPQKLQQSNESLVSIEESPTPLNEIPPPSYEISQVIPHHKPRFPSSSIQSLSPQEDHLDQVENQVENKSNLVSNKIHLNQSNTENALIGPFYPHQSYGYFSKKGGLRKSSSLFQMIENIKKEKLEDRFLIRHNNTYKKRFYGNFASMDFLLKSSYWVNKLRPGQYLEVSDISSERGGKLGKHSSHQNGLDMDIGYFFHGLEENFYGRRALSRKGGFDPKFDQSFLWTYFKTMMANYHDKIFMIFIHPSIKRAMCAEAKRVGDLNHSDKDKKINPIVLNALSRLWPDKKGGHADHFHLRLRCPKWSQNLIDGKKFNKNRGDIAKCVMPQGDVPMRTGCSK